MGSRILHALTSSTLLLADATDAATLAITSDKSTYMAGETITLSVFGDPQGMPDNGIFGRLLFDPALVDYLDSSQAQLTSFSGGFPWITGTLFGGDGFVDAFNQTPGGSPLIPDGSLAATVTLFATNSGSLAYGWQTDGSLDLRLDFFGLTNAPGGSVTIVPEPATALLLALGLFGLGLKRSTGLRDGICVAPQEMAHQQKGSHR